jgi:hypothetical protein
VDYLLFRDSVEGPDVVLQGDSSKRVDGGGDSGDVVDYLLFRDGVEGPDVARELMAEETVESEWITFCSGTV